MVKLSVPDLWNTVKPKTYEYNAVLTASWHTCCQSLQRGTLSVVIQIVLH